MMRSNRTAARRAQALALLSIAVGGSFAHFACVGSEPTVSGSTDAGGSDGPGIDGGSADASDGGGVDAGDADRARCNVTTPFTSSVLLKNVTTPADDFRITLSDDERIAYFKTVYSPDDAGAVHRIWTSTRTSASSDFATPVLADELNSPGSISGGPSLTPNGLTIYFFSNRPGGVNGSLDLWVATRGSTSQKFSQPGPLMTVNTASDETGPTIRSDGAELFFQRNSADLFHAQLVNGVFATPTQLTELSAPGVRDYPAISADGLTLYFKYVPQGSTAISTWMARRATTSDPFGSPTQVTELGAATPSWLSTDNCRLYVAQDRGDSGQGRDFYVYARLP